MSGTGPQRPSNVFRLLEQRVANPLLRRILRTPLARLFGDRLVLFSYTGRRSGAQYSTPVVAIPDQDTRVVTTYRADANWWHNFREGHPATLWIRGTPVPVRGTAVTDPDRIADWLERLSETEHDRLVGMLGLQVTDDRSAFESAGEALVVVRFEAREDPGRAI